MGSRGTARVRKPAKKSRFSPQEKIEQARVGASVRRKTALTEIIGHNRTSRQFLSDSAADRIGQVRRRYKRNPLPRANRNPKTAPGGGAPRRPRG